MVQAALCNKLGARTTVSNLPASVYLFGSFAPFFFSWFVPYRAVRTVVVAAYWSTAALLATVCILLVFPVTDRVRIAAVIGHGVIQGLSSSVAFVYMWQCLKRGTTLDGRARALKLTFTVGPIAAVGGSLGAQFVLNHGIPAFEYPYDFAFLESEAQREALSGFVLGVIAARFGIRGPLITTVCLLGLVAVWPLLAPCYT